MKRLMTAVAVLVLSSVSVFAQFRPVEPPAPAPAPNINIAPAPNINVAPNVNVPRSEAAAAEDRKLRAAMAIFRHQSVTLNETTQVTPHDNGTYSARADFTVQGESVSLRFVSVIREAVVACMEYVTHIFRNSSTQTDWTLEDIVSNARRTIMDRFNLSEDQLTVKYIDQFDETHVVEISRDRSQLKFASR